MRTSKGRGKFRLLVDSCVWFDLAQDPKQEPLLAAIEQMVARGTLSLIVPRVVLDELDRNQERIAAESAKSLASHFRIVREAANRLEADRRKKKSFFRQLEEIQRKAPMTGGWGGQAISRIARLLNSVQVTEQTDAAMRLAGLRALEGRAPFHLGRNSMADAVLMEAYAECFRAETDTNVAFGFVTHNTNDFSQQHGNKTLPHSDLAGIFASPRSRYFIKLSDALGAFDPSVLASVRSYEPRLRDLINRFMAERKRPLGQSFGYGLKRMAASPLGEKVATSLRTSDLIRYGRTRASEGKSRATLRQDIIYLRGVIATAARDWGVNISLRIVDEARAALTKQGLIGTSQARLRRPTPGEYSKLIAYFSLPGKTRRLNMVELLEFTVNSALRIREICRLQWSDFDVKAQTIRVRDRITPSSGARRTDTLYLSDKALEVILRQPHREERIFPFNSMSASQAFINAVKALGIRDLWLDDIRREAFFSWFDQGVPPHEVARRMGMLRIDPLMHRYELQLMKQARGKSSAASSQLRRLSIATPS